MKKLLLAIGLAVAVAVSAQAGSISVSPLAVTAASGVRWVESVVVIDVSGAEVLDMIFTWDPTKAAVNGMPVEGGYMANQTGEAPNVYQSIDNVNGVLSYTVNRMGPNTSSGSGTAAYVTFRSKTSDPYPIHYFVSLINLSMIRFYVGEGNIAVNGWTEGPGVIPEPMTLALIASALAGLGVYARKRG